MLDDAKSYLNKRAAQLGLDRAQALQAAQTVLDGLYPGQTRAKSLHNGVLKVITPSSAVASELRLRQIDLLKKLAEAMPGTYQLERLHITTQSF